MIGSTVGHYRVLEKIGEGGMGEVYLAEDAKLRRRVSLKFLAGDLTEDRERRDRFIQEARAAAAVEHPHIAAIYDIDETGGRTFIAMEYVRGESLRDKLNRGKLDVKKSLALALAIADGLAAAHDRGVIHRDLKPENVLLSERGYVKIIDFGLAKLIEPLVPTGEDGSPTEVSTQVKTREGMVMGTVAYMSPEQARGERVDARSDIFSFGVLLHEMLTGVNPFLKRSMAETLSAILNEPAPVADAAVSPALAQTIQKALGKDPKSRYQTMQDFADDLRAIRDEMLSGARAATPRARPAWVLWSSVAAVALGGVVAVWLLPDAETEPPGIGVSGRPSVAVLYFESMSGDEEIHWLSKGLPNMLVTDLAQTPGLDVVSSHRIHEILTQLGQENVESTDKAVASEVARRAGAGAAVVGSIFKAGDEIRIDVQVEDVSSGRVISAESVRGSDVFPLVDELTVRIRSGLQVEEPVEVRSLAEVTTPSLEAFQLYSEGVEAWKNVRFGEARTYFERALELDPTFALALTGLSELATFAGETSVARDYLQRAYENLDRLPERQRLLVEARHARRAEDDPYKSAAILESLIGRYPDEESAYMSLSNLYSRLNEREKSIATLERGVEALPRAGPLYNLYGYGLLHSGRYPEAIRAFESYARLAPGEPNAHDSLGEAYLITGQAELAIEQYTTAIEPPHSFVISHTGRAFANAAVGRYDAFFHDVEVLKDSSDVTGFPPATFYFARSFGLSRVGRYREAEAERREGIEVARRSDDPVRLGALELLVGVHALEHGDATQAIGVASRVESLDAEMSSLSRRYLTVAASLVSGTAAARSGDVETARRHLESQRQVMNERDDAERWWHHALEGEISLARREVDAAETAFAAGEPASKMTFSLGPPRGVIWTILSNSLPFHDGRARALLAQGDLAGAIQIYQDLVTADMSSKWVSMLEPRYVLRLARLLDEAGDRDGARAEYERFLDLWKNADPGLPELEEARRYLHKEIAGR